ncbi:dihydrofolate reductase family protein [Chitinophaga sancti]|uniref:Dihydrofolate reductase n=1 Tax=Chitinophaga sancti TaxID=1004 RepID=A0A1K1QYQ8_9BACT|nr:dihydrofolate reductase family protein [Chitinophaga sancti]WQD62099.1 dihydrofolate reductase family protein [Chitinophaga sancti]WQG92332.1 dihydrofolate reductase family protein [Chitinophaga sancti]SFW65031.1 Dihydrofolate reductase [Chitinophaga sancti]
MRKLIYGSNISMDGCCDHTKIGGKEDILNYFRELFEEVDLIIYGRQTYELMYPFWPEVAQKGSDNAAEYAFAKVFSAIDNIVVSSSLESVENERTSILSDNIKEEILRLKQQPGKAISTGGVTLPAQLIEWDLVDEFHIVVHPVIVGEGRRLFSEMSLPENRNLKLVSTTTLSSGCVALRYERD